MSIASPKLWLPILSIGLLASGCFLKPKKKSGGTGNNARFSVINDDIFMNRIGDGTSARIRFQTSEKVFCELAHYSQEEGGLPSKEDPTITGCPNEEARDDFILRLDNLATDTLYWVKITVFKDKETRSPSESVIVQEGMTSDPDVPPAGGPVSYKNIFVARINVPLKTSEVHRHKLPESKSLAQIKESLNREIGCQAGFPSASGPFRDPQNDILLNSLATTSFAADKAETHPDYKGVRRLEYAGLNPGLDQWKFLYQLDSKDTEVKARSGNLIQSVEIDSTESALLPEPQLADAVDALVIDGSAQLTVKWETDANLLSSSFMQVYIGRPGNPNSVYCVFPAKDKRGVVPETYISKLEKTKHVILTLLESNQFLASDGWFASTYDWRSGRIEKL